MPIVSPCGYQIFKNDLKNPLHGDNYCGSEDLPLISKFLWILIIMNTCNSPISRAECASLFSY